MDMHIHIPNEQPEKRSVTIAGHRTSLSLEPTFWKALKRIADDADMSLSALITAIDDARPETTNLSSAIRLYLFNNPSSRA
ncbi:MAG: ribbon-helix-helix domain-containing protein [Pseudomonadota bacterium]|nr:ribbon-helix-helix domain-containing protein [Pseudomonadota bacterium]MEC9234638.1 ribbon-helix-helix domain-containing protein [Pseudomonadota bacterium]